ncbi:hypothetical protein [Adhaeretor mobilis]|uniref:hypothetical protein n=1 Tax=Adhaeretor mobilis TaxID=1930276 RepID=UPI00119ED010|nr:hypothetical protein [Adhaeretor mobilis]
MAAAVLADMACSASAITIADAAGDYLAAAGSTSTAPLSPPTGWSYLGADMPNGGTEISLTAGDVGNQGASYQGFVGGSTAGTAAVYGTNTASSLEFEIFSNGEDNGAVVGTDLLLHPGQGGNADEFVIARYTISTADAANAAAGTGSISGSFRELIIGGGAAVDSISADIYHNTNNLFSVTGNQSTANALTQAEGTFNLTGLTFAENDTIDFVVGINGHFGADETALQAIIEVEQTQPTELLTLQVHTLSGDVSLINGSQPQDIDFYSIASLGVALNFDGWNSLEDQDFEGNGAPGTGNGWEQSGGSGDTVLTEAYLTGSSVIAADSSISIGSAFDPTEFGAGNDGDLTFQYRLADGSVVPGLVEYVTSGDFDADLDIDGVDFLAWQRGFGTMFDASDLEDWQDHYGAGGTSPSLAVAVPEPASIVLVIFSLLAGQGFFRRQSRPAR